MYTKLDVFDFDSTLVETPTMSDENKQKWADYYEVDKWPYIAWWTRKESLDLNVFDIPTNPEIIKAYKKSKNEPDTLTIMLTGRVITLEPQVKDILSKYGLTFDGYFFKEGGLTEHSKMQHMANMLDKYPTIDSIEMWDDRIEHIPKFERWGRYIEHTDNVKFKLNKVVNGRPTS
jgi:hypothetical protein